MQAELVRRKKRGVLYFETAREVTALLCRVLRVVTDRADGLTGRDSLNRALFAVQICGATSRAQLKFQGSGVGALEAKNCTQQACDRRSDRINRFLMVDPINLRSVILLASCRTDR